MNEIVQAYAFLDYIRTRLGEKDSKKVFYILVTLAAGGVFAAVVGLTMLGVVAPWSGRFYSLWDTGTFTHILPKGSFQIMTTV